MAPTDIHRCYKDQTVDVSMGGGGRGGFSTGQQQRLTSAGSVFDEHGWLVAGENTQLMVLC